VALATDEEIAMKATAYRMALAAATFAALVEAVSAGRKWC